MSRPDATCIDEASPSKPAVGGPAPRILTRQMVLMLLSLFGAMTSFYLLLAVVPLYSTSVGANDMSAGLSTGILLLATVAAEFATPYLTERLGQRSAYALSLIMLGVPALALLICRSTPSVLLVCVIRGAGFGINAVISYVLVAAIAPAKRRGEALGLYAIIVGIPAVVVLPLGIWLVARVGYPALFVLGGLSALAGLLVVPALPNTAAPRSPQESTAAVIHGLRGPALRRPVEILFVCAMAAGIGITYVPLATRGMPSNIAAAALLLHSLVATFTRWRAGLYADRKSPAGLLAPGGFVAAAGVFAIIAISSPAAVILGMSLLGAGFGIIQSASMTLMFARVPASEYGAASAIWNIAYDAGWGLGATLFGSFALHTGYPAGFASLAVAMTGYFIWRLRRAGRPQ